MTWAWLDNFLWFVVAMIAIVQISAISQQLAGLNARAAEIIRALHELDPYDEQEIVELPRPHPD